MLKTFAIIFILLLMAGQGACEEAFVYNANGRRDPFMPLITENIKFGSGLVGVQTADDLNLEGIVWDPEGGSVAILNGMILKEYEQINNVKITKIEPTKITLTINNAEYTIKLIKEEK